MTSTVDIDKRIYQIIKHNSMSISAPPYPKVGNMIINVHQLVESTKSLIREVVEQVTPSKVIAVEYDEKYDHNDGNTHATPDYALGWNDCISEQRTKLNNLLGKEK